MVWTDKVVWQEGMFLRAQHFQQQDRHFEQVLQARVAPLHPYAWGLTELALDRDLLAAGKFAVSAASGVLEDGTTFAIPATADQPQPLDLPEGARNVIVYLAAPLRQAGNAEIAFGDDPGRAGARFGLANFEAFDTHSDSTMPAELQVGRLRLRFLLERPRSAPASPALGWRASSRCRPTAG